MFNVILKWVLFLILFFNLSQLGAVEKSVQPSTGDFTSSKYDIFYLYSLSQKSSDDDDDDDGDCHEDDDDDEHDDDDSHDSDDDEHDDEDCDDDCDEEDDEHDDDEDCDDDDDCDEHDDDGHDDDEDCDDDDDCSDDDEHDDDDNGDCEDENQEEEEDCVDEEDEHDDDEDCDDDDDCDEHDDDGHDDDESCDDDDDCDEHDDDGHDDDEDCDDGDDCDEHDDDEHDDDEDCDDDDDCDEHDDDEDDEEDHEGCSNPNPPPPPPPPPVVVDLGDAPASYGEASHVILTANNPSLGLVAPDADVSPQTSFDATADDDTFNGIDDEGDTIFLVASRSSVPLCGEILSPGSLIDIIVETTGAGNLSGWVDWNDDGVFSIAEQILTDVPSIGGQVSAQVLIPRGAAIGPAKMLRLRYSTDVGLAPFGAASDGEVEDCTVDVFGR